MIDLQSVFIRDVVRLFDIDFVTMVKVVGEDLSALTAVSVNGTKVKHIATGGGVLYAALPPGVSFPQVNSLRLHRSVTTADGTFEVTELVKMTQLSVDSGLIKVTGEDFSKVSSVRVNKLPVDYVVLDNHTLYCTIPESIKTLENVDVISTSKTISRTSFFEYLLGEDPHVVSGPAKMLFQFLKVLMTTPGSDAFNKDVGGNMQNWVGQRVPLDNPQSLVAKTVVSIVGVAGKMSSRQLIAGVPPEERLSSVQVLNVGFDPETPDVMELDIKLVSYAQQTAVFGLLLGTVDETVSNLALKGT